MSIARQRPYGPTTEAAVGAFEQRLRAPLPGDFRDFLLASNGCEFRDATVFQEIDGGSSAAAIFGIHAGPDHLRLDHVRTEFLHTQIPFDVVVFANDTFGNWFCISFAGPDQGAVYFVDHECLLGGREWMIRIANSFNEFLARAGADADVHETPISVEDAIEQGDVRALRRIAACGSGGVGHVCRAVRNGDLEIVRAVLECGGDADESWGIGDGKTALFIAAMQGRADIAELLLERGANPNAHGADGVTVLEAAVPHAAVLRLLVLAGAVPTTRWLEVIARRIRRAASPRTYDTITS